MTSSLLEGPDWGDGVGNILGLRDGTVGGHRRDHAFGRGFAAAPMPCAGTSRFSF